MQNKINYQAEKCACCGQTETYIMTIDAGTCGIVQAVAAAIRKKKENCISPRNEMEIGKEQTKLLGYNAMIREGYLTSTMVGNLSKARSQGLIARVQGKPGNYCLTTKGAEFLKGASVPRYAIMSKVTRHNIGYWHDIMERVKLKDLIKSSNYWEIDFNIIDRAVVFNLQKTMAFNF